MNRFSTIFAYWSAILTIALIFPASAYAYIDLGTGSYIIQILLGGLLGGLLGLKIYWKKILSFFRRSPQRNDEPHEG